MQQLLSKVLEISRKFLSGLNSKPVLLISVGFFIFLVGASRYYQIRILSFTKSPAEAQTTAKGELPLQITIPSIGIDHSVEIGAIKDGVWQISYDHPTFLDSSARPGTGGNIVIYGHNKKAIFGNLPYLSIGQKIYIKTTDGKIRVYEAYRKDFVAPTRVDLVSPENKEELTIYTCYGLFDQQRVVIKAKPVY